MKLVVSLVVVLAGLLTAAPAQADPNYCVGDALPSYARVALFAGAQCGGGSVSVNINESNGDRPNFGAFRNFDGRVYNVDNSRSSLALRAGSCVRVFDGVNYSGSESNILCAPRVNEEFVLSAFNDKVSSMRICQIAKQYHCSRTGGGGTAPPSPPLPAPPAPGPTPGGGSGGAVDPLRTDSVRRCASGPQPGAIALRDWLAANVPQGRSGGIFNCRNVRGGRSLSLHGAGRAVDWMLSANNSTQKRAADALVALLLATQGSERWALARRMGVQEIIWNRKIWTASKATQGLRAYRPGPGGSPHTNNIHIGMNVPGSLRQSSFWR